MQYSTLTAAAVALSIASKAAGHVALWHPAMFGMNVTTALNKPQDPLQDRTFGGDKGWWMHAYMDHPPPPDVYMDLPAGGEVFFELTCDIAASSSYKAGLGTDLRKGNEVCPGHNTLEFHTKNIQDTKGTALGIVYTPATEIKSIQPEDITIFSVNHTSPWERFTKYQIPAKMPACPKGGCTCVWMWIHSADAGSEQNYMIPYACQILNPTSNVPIAKPQLARRCGADNTPELVRVAAPKNCTYGAKQPIYWKQKERNTFFENAHAAPYYNDLYGFKDGAQNDIFVDSVLPEMDWVGAPITGKLAQVAGSFTGSLNDIIPQSFSQPAPQAQSPSPSSGSNDNNKDNNNKDGQGSGSSSSAPAPSPTTKITAPNNVESDASGDNNNSSSSPAASPTPSSSNIPAHHHQHHSKKLCKNKHHQHKRSIMESLRFHKRQSSSFRRHH